MRITTALATAVVLMFPALAAGAHPRGSLRHVDAAAGPIRLSMLHTQNGASGAAVVSQTPTQGAITLEARQVQGAQEVDVQGTAPAGAPVTITLLALLSPDIPTTLVSRHDVVTDVGGRFGAVVPIAPAFETGTILTIVATSAPGVTSAQAQVVTGAPNAGASVPLDTDETAH
jgi:hypothetical protein